MRYWKIATRTPGRCPDYEYLFIIADSPEEAEEKAKKFVSNGFVVCKVDSDDEYHDGEIIEYMSSY